MMEEIKKFKSSRSSSRPEEKKEEKEKIDIVIKKKTPPTSFFEEITRRMTPTSFLEEATQRCADKLSNVVDYKTLFKSIQRILKEFEKLIPQDVEINKKIYAKLNPVRFEFPVSFEHYSRTLREAIPESRKYFSFLKNVEELTEKFGSGNGGIIMRKSFIQIASLLYKSLEDITKFLEIEYSPSVSLAALTDIWEKSVVTRIKETNECVILWIDDNPKEEALCANEDKAVIFSAKSQEISQYLKKLAFFSIPVFSARFRLAIDSKQPDVVLTALNKEIENDIEKNDSPSNIRHSRRHPTNIEKSTRSSRTKAKREVSKKSRNLSWKDTPLDIIINKEQVKEEGLNGITGIRDRVTLSAGTIGFVNFVKFATLLWVGPIEEALANAFRRNGVVVFSFPNLDGVLPFMDERSYLYNLIFFRVVIIEEAVALDVKYLVGYIREKTSAPILILTHSERVEVFDYTVHEYAFVKTTTMATDTEIFGTMGVLHWAKPELRFPKTSKRKKVRGGLLTIHSIECNNLYPMDNNGKSDPFAVVYCSE